MKTIASTFITGLQPVVKAMLTDALPDARIRLMLDGLVVYETGAGPEALEALPFFNNSFRVLRTFRDLNRQPIDRMAARLARDRRLVEEVRSVRRETDLGRTFRIMALDRNRHVSFRGKERRAIEQRLSSLRGFRVDRGRPDTEFWLLYRDEGYGFFLVRLTQHTAYEEVLERGELAPELAYTLCYLSEPEADDIFLDPFCGWGSIPLQRAASFPFNMIFAADQDPAMKTRVRRKAKDLRTDGLFIAKTEDALTLSAFEDGFIHKIATDPPWGYFEELDRDIDAFYGRMMQQFRRVLMPGGIMVILTARKAALDRALADAEGALTLLARYDILVSGKKAAIYKIRKVSA